MQRQQFSRGCRSGYEQGDQEISRNGGGKGIDCGSFITERTAVTGAWRRLLPEADLALLVVVSGGAVWCGLTGNYVASAPHAGGKRYHS